MIKAKNRLGLAAITILAVLAWYAIGAGLLLLLSRLSFWAVLIVGSILFLPMLPGGPFCVIAGAHSTMCLPASFFGNVVFYLVLVFWIRGRKV